MSCIEARGLRKTFGSTIALDGVDLRVEEGRILGLIGPNGAGKSTALNAIFGLIPYQGELKVLGRDPWIERDRLMRDVCFIADVAVLPRWVRVAQALDYVAGVRRWLLLISAWARRTPFLWVVLPPLALFAVEMIAFHTSYFAALLRYCLLGAMTEAFNAKPMGGAMIDRLEQLDPIRFLSSPGLWIGLAVTAGFLAAAVWLRRYREPI